MIRYIFLHDYSSILSFCLRFPLQDEKLKHGQLYNK